jgi:type IV pilus assembly protein PilX
MRSPTSGHARPALRAQGGAVLITGVIFLVVLTLFVLAMVRSGTLEERMARNARDHQIALEAAEAVLRDAETTMFNKAPFDPFDSTQFTTACTNGLCFQPVAAKSWKTVDWSSASWSRSFADTASNINGLTNQPRYMIEIVAPPVKSSSTAPCTYGLAKVTARGAGNDGAVTFVQSTFRFRVFSNICS